MCSMFVVCIVRLCVAAKEVWPLQWYMFSSNITLFLFGCWEELVQASCDLTPGYFSSSANSLLLDILNSLQYQLCRTMYDFSPSFSCS